MKAIKSTNISIKSMKFAKENRIFYFKLTKTFEFGK